MNISPERIDEASARKTEILQQLQQNYPEENWNMQKLEENWRLIKSLNGKGKYEQLSELGNLMTAILALTL